MNKFFLPSSALTALLLSGCTIGPDYVRPQIQTPESFLHTQPQTTQAQAIDKEWWKRFNDPRLNDAIETALRSNFDLVASRASVEALLGQFDQAKSYLYPQINANGSMTKKGVDNASTGGYQLREGVTSTYAGSLSLASYEIDLFGKVRRANESARAALLSGEYASQTLKLSTASAVAASYLRLSSLQGQIALAQENVALSRELHNLSLLKHTHGVIAETVVLQSLSEVQSAQATLSQLEASKIAEEANFNLLLGRNPATVETTPLESIAIPPLPAVLPSEILHQRPDIAMAEQNLIAANARIGVARAAYFPSIKLTGMLGLQSMELNNFVSNPARIWEIAPSITVPIFSAGRIAGEIKTAEADQNRTLALYQKSIVNAFNDTDSALGQHAKAKEQFGFQHARTEAIQNALRQSKLRYHNGTISYDAMLLVQQQWLQASQQKLIAQQNLLTSALNLYKALGGGWSAQESPKLPDLLPSGR
jgi:outer membrane protein, multidrug efflux system